MTHPEANTSPPSRHRRHWRIGVVLVAILVVGVVLLDRLGNYLRLDEAPRGWGSHVVYLGGSGSKRQAIDFLKADPAHHLLLIQKTPARPMQLGVLPEFHLFARDQFMAMGVGAESIEFLPGSAFGVEGHVRALARWLAEHPDAEVILLVDGWEGRRWRMTLDKDLDEKTSRRVRVRSVLPAVDSRLPWWWKKNEVVRVAGECVQLWGQTKGGRANGG